MKNLVKRIGFIAFIAVIGFVTAACEVEAKHGDDIDLKYLPGTWKAYDKNGADEITVTIVFSQVTNGKITMKITEHTVYHGGASKVTGATTGYHILDQLFGMGQTMSGGSLGGSYDTDVWERTYTQAEIKTLHWDLRTLRKESTLYIHYLIPAGKCDCENCPHYDKEYGSNNCCSNQYCGSEPQGNLSALIESNKGLSFKKQ